LIGEVRTLDPLSPLFAAKEAHYLQQDGQLDLAAATYERALRSALDVNKEAYWYGLAEVRRAQDRFDDAIMIRRRLDGGRDDALDNLLATARGAAGYQQIERHVAQLDLDQLKKLAASGAYVAPIDRARLHATLGDSDEAFHDLDEAFAIRDPGVVMLRADHAWAPLRADPRFAAAIALLRLP
jgi:tetratricopeptide (TPR) repeat protein